MERLRDTVSLVTGAGSGIGRAVAERLAGEGARVLAADIDGGAAQATAAAVEGDAITLDVTQPDSWREIAPGIRAAVGAIDGLVNCAGVDGVDDNIIDCTPEAWRRVMAANLDGTFLGMQAAVSMMGDRGGAIVNISSILGVVADGEALAYSSSKGAVRGLTKSVALELADRGIRCNSVHPGYIQTPMTDRWLAALQTAGLTLTDLEQLHPLGRLGDPADIASVVAYLLSDEAAFVTGAELAVDGGYLAV